jgi:CheY-like chemotaxis protein
MSGILGFADLLKSPDLSSESKNSYIETIISSGKRMLGIINDLIYISKIEAGQLELYKDVTDLHKLIDELKIFFQPEADKKNLTLKANKSLPPDKTLIETDKTKLSQVLTNLIKNAIKYTTSGYVEFGCRFQGVFYIFYVKDTGIGIKEEHQTGIFERFKQGEISTESLEGLGLGLAISKSLVEALGGTIWVESEPKLGSTFYFTIPYREMVYPIKKAHKDDNIEIDDLLPECEVLIAEDEEFIYYFLEQFLSKKNIKTLHATNGEEAITMVLANPNIKLVLMDTRMPVLNGLEATKRIKQLKPDLPVIALSAFASSQDVQQTIKAGCVDYIVKPFNKEIVMQKISMYVGATSEKK